MKLLWRWIWLLRKCTIVGHRSQSTKIAVPHRYLEDSIFIHKARHHIYPMELIWVNDALPFGIWLNFPPRHFSKQSTNKYRYLTSLYVSHVWINITQLPSIPALQWFQMSCLKPWLVGVVLLGVYVTQQQHRGNQR